MGLNTVAPGASLPGVMRALVYLGALPLAAACSKDSPSGEDRFVPNPVAVTTAVSTAKVGGDAAPASPFPASASNDGRDASKAILAPEDGGFVDPRNGWGWSDRCWQHLGQNLLGYAKAECEAGMKITAQDSAANSPRPSLLYNLGLIQERSGSPTAAKALYEQSLDLRANPEVESALRRVGGTPKPKAAEKTPEQRCREMCPGEQPELTRCYCVCVGQCTD